MHRYVDIILPLALPGTFTYRLPEWLMGQVGVGCRVVVPLGKSKYYTGIVHRLHDTPPAEGIVVKDVCEVIDGAPIILPTGLKLWEWISSYYLCHLGEVMKAALPSGLKLESETLVSLNPDAAADTPTEEVAEKIVQQLKDGKAQRIDALAKAIGYARIDIQVRRLVEQGLLVVEEKLARSFRPRTETKVRLGKKWASQTDANEIWDALRRTPKQEKLLQAFFYLTECPLELQGIRDDEYAVLSKKRLAQHPDFSASAFDGLRRKEILEVFTAEVSRLKTPKALPQALTHALDEQQSAALQQIEASWQKHNVCLLHGVTSSGKTEVYIELIRREIAAGRQVLYLVPEIALTTQLTTRLGRVFGDKMGIYHSKFPDAERVELWQRQLTSTPFPLILGVRSSVFLPFQNLGLIIVDEEHETSYKQQDPAPRYNARDAAILLARFVGARTLLGTATPAVETYYNAHEGGKYGYVSMTKRHGDVALPEIIVEDVKELKRKKMMKSPFSPRLAEEVNQALDEGGQAILFYNRRGYSPVMECRSCGWTPHCNNCDVPLTFHQRIGKLTCHYCGATYDIPRQCPQCEDTDLKDIGYGTEKIESAVQGCFPKAKTARMDLDTTRSRDAYEKIINDFQNGQSNLLVGTQMVTKGLDFDRVRVVGILNADQALNIPDFRAHERAYQMLSQVAGRAGRRGKQGKVILQTRQANLPLIKQIVRNDYEAMYLTQVAERKAFGYPPFTRIINIYVKHRDERICVAAASHLATMLRPHFGTNLLGPDRPSIGRIQSLHIRKMMLKVVPSLPPQGTRRTLLAAVEVLKNHPALKGVALYFDVDPLG